MSRASAVLVVIALVGVPHALGLGPLPWLMMSEIQPTRIRAKAVAISTSCLWLAGFVAPLLFPIIVEASQELNWLDCGGLFAVCGRLRTSLCVWHRMAAGDQNKTLEEIATLWKERTKSGS